MTGTIPAALGKLTALEEMEFWNAVKLSGKIALPASSQLVPGRDLNAPFHYFLTRAASICFLRVQVCCPPNWEN